MAKSLKNGKTTAGEAFRRIFFAIVFLVMIVYVLSMFVLLFWGLISSLKSFGQFNADPVGFPKGSIFRWEWANYSNAFRLIAVPVPGRRVKIPLLYQFGYSLLYAGGSAFFATLIPCVVAYMTAKFPYKFSKLVYAVVIVTMGLPIVGALPSEIQTAQRLGLYNHIWGIWIMKANFLGMYYLVFHAAFSSMPKDFCEAAEIDGASNLRIFVSIVMPIVRNTFVTVMLLKFIEFWNDYQTPMIYLPDYPTAAYGIYWFNFATMTEGAWPPTKISGAMLMLIPVLIIFLCFHKRLIGNVTMGGIKE